MTGHEEAQSHQGQRWEATAHANKHSPLTHAASASYSATPSTPPPWTSLHAVSHNKPLQVALARYFVAAKRKVTNKPIFSYSYLWYQNNNTIPMICPDLLTITCRMDLGNHPHFIEVSGHNSHKRGSNAHSCLTYHHHDTLTPAPVRLSAKHFMTSLISANFFNTLRKTGVPIISSRQLEPLELREVIYLVWDSNQSLVEPWHEFGQSH